MYRPAGGAAVRRARRGTAGLPTPATGEATFNILFKGIQVGREQVTLSRGSAGWIITSSGTSGPPINLNIRRFEMKYTDDWQPLELKIEAVLRNAGIALATSFSMTTAINEVSQNGTTNSKEDQITARTVVLPNNFYASYEALAVHLAASQVDAEIPVYVAPQAEIRVKVRAITTQALAGPTGTMDIRRYDLTFNNPGTPLDGSVSIDNRSRFVRLELPSAGLHGGARRCVERRVARDNLAQSDRRRRHCSRQRIQPRRHAHHAADGCRSAALSSDRAGWRLGPPDRDETVVGIPIFAQLAKTLADNGFIVLRYDKRGVGQSGGRTETATLSDYADDVVSAVRWIARRNDMDPRKIVVVATAKAERLR